MATQTEEKKPQSQQLTEKVLEHLGYCAIGQPNPSLLAQFLEEAKKFTGDENLPMPLSNDPGLRDLGHHLDRLRKALALQEESIMKLEKDVEAKPKPPELGATPPETPPTKPQPG